jgi:hypothetical protein
VAAAVLPSAAPDVALLTATRETELVVLGATAAAAAFLGDFRTRAMGVFSCGQTVTVALERRSNVC